MENNISYKEEILIGLDLGTGSLKAVAFDLRGHSLASATVSYPIYRGENGVSEQNPADYRTALFRAIKELKDACPLIGKNTVGIGITGQCPTETLLGENDEPLRPMIVWNDTRASEEAALIRARYSAEELLRLRKMPIAVSPSWTDARLLWIRRHEPEIYAKKQKYIMAKDYLTFCLTGQHCSDGWSMKTVMDLETGRYLEEYLAFLGYSVREMPAIQSWCSQAGTLRPKMAAEVGLPEKVFVNVGCGDALATILGSGTFERSRIAFNSAGTSEIVGLSVEEKILSKEVMTIPGFITKSYDVHYGPTQSGSSSVLWFMQNVLGENDFEKVVREAEKVEAGAGGMFFVPYLSGERSPIWNPSATGSFQGIRAPYDRRYFIRSIMEGVCFSVRHVLEYCSRTAANKPTCLRISGGGSRTRLWCQMKADVCGLPVQRPVVTESAALGAAMGAAIAGGYYPDSSAATAHMVEMGEWLEPDRARHARYDEIYEQYRNVAEKYKAE